MVYQPYAGQDAGMAALFDRDPAKDEENRRKGRRIYEANQGIHR
jgi:hypothetical protein